MDEEENIGAALDAPEYMYGGAPVIEDPASFAVAPTGTQMDLSFLDEPTRQRQLSRFLPMSARRRPKGQRSAASR
jgi:hypothetical protein